MKALVWHGKRDVRVDEVPEPTIQEPTDAHQGDLDRDLRLRPAALEGLVAELTRGQPRPRARGGRGGRVADVPLSPATAWSSRSTSPGTAMASGSCMPVRTTSSGTGQRSLRVQDHGAVPGGQADTCVPQAQFGPIPVPEGPSGGDSSTLGTCQAWRRKFADGRSGQLSAGLGRGRACSRRIGRAARRRARRRRPRREVCLGCEHGGTRSRSAPRTTAAALSR